MGGEAGQGSADPSDGAIHAKWVEFAAAVDRLVERVGDPADFAVLPGSSLAGDDRATHPFELSQALRHLINASVDQLNGIKVLMFDMGTEHLAVGSTLARAALENTATALWMLGPKSRDERIKRTLRWRVRDYQDEDHTVGKYIGNAAKEHIEEVVGVAVTRGLDGKGVRSGYKVETPIRGSMEFTSMQVDLLWRSASALAHGRPWAYRGFLRRDGVTVDEHGHGTAVLRPNGELSIWLPIAALHLLGELMRMRDRRAGFMPPPMPNGAPDSEPADTRGHARGGGVSSPS